MDTRELVLLVGLIVAACGHLLLNDLVKARAVWMRLESWFPPVWRSEPDFAGVWLLAIGGFSVLVSAFG